MVTIRLDSQREMVIYKGREVIAPIGGGIRAMLELIKREKLND